MLAAIPWASSRSVYSAQAYCLSSTGRGDDDAMTRHGALMAQLLAKIGVITKELTPSSAHTSITNNLTLSPDYYVFQQRAAAVLRRFPEVWEAWQQEFRQSPEPKLIEGGDASR